MAIIAISCYTHSCTRFCVDILSFILSIYLRLKFLDHVVTSCITFEELPNHCTLLSAMYQLVHSGSSIVSLACYYVFLILASLVTVRECVKTTTKTCGLHLDFLLRLMMHTAISFLERCLFRSFCQY